MKCHGEGVLEEGWVQYGLSRFGVRALQALNPLHELNYGLFGYVRTVYRYALQERLNVG